MTASCRKAGHAFGEPDAVGGGLLRRACRGCGAVEICPGGSATPIRGRFGLFRGRVGSLFAVDPEVRRVVAWGASNERFGARPTARRTPEWVPA
ncbi:MAG: hypothetical protein ACRDVM_04965 [Acidimicrobiia bacterium]